MCVPIETDKPSEKGLLIGSWGHVDADQVFDARKELMAGSGTDGLRL